MWNWISQIQDLTSQGRPFAIVTVTQSTGSAPREVGAKMIVLEDGTFHGSIGGGNLEYRALEDARRILREERSQSIRYPLGAKTGQCCGGVVDLFFEVQNTGPDLYLFGAGHVAQAICKTLADTPFRVHLIDERREWIESDELPKSISRHAVEWDVFAADARWDERRTFAVVMTHRHDLDQEIIEKLIQLPARYIGLIGSESKWERFKQRMSAKGVSPSLIDRVRCPIGIPIGGKSPKEIAISFGAEILKLHHGNA